MIKTILLLMFGGLVISTGSILGYRHFTNPNKGKIKGELDTLSTSFPTPTLTITSTIEPEIQNDQIKKTIPPTTVPTLISTAAQPTNIITPTT